jgi:pimeloyl-ACP methyl ester carboxylesterase
MNPTHRRSCGADAVLVLLPGALMTPQHIVDAGLLQALDDQDQALDLIVPDLHAGMLDNREALGRLRDEFLLPAREQYRQVWLGGISRGGQLALCCWAERWCAVDGLCLLAPYAGSRLVSRGVARAGGLADWRPDGGSSADPDVRLWLALQAAPPPVPTFMGWGASDRFVDGMDLLAQALPQVRPLVLPGGHDWDAWRPLWRQFLDRFATGELA